MNIKKIGEISTQIRGVSYGKHDARNSPANNYIPIVRANNIQNYNLDLNDLVYVPISKVSDKQKMRQGDIVIAASSGSIDIVGKANSIKTDMDMSFGAFCKILRPDLDVVDERYFANYFSTQKYRKIISSLAAGANINNLRNEHLDNLEIPLPPLPEQKRIAQILDKADELRQKRQQSIEKLDELLQATFIDMLGDPVSNPKGWETKPLKNLALKVQSGNTPKGGKENYLKEGITFFRSQNVWKNKIIYDDIGICQHSCHPYLNQATKTSLALTRLDRRTGLRAVG